MPSFPPYVGRFAPSPSGPLHAGSLVAALASYLDARAQHGHWLVRIEDIDEPRTVPGADRIILRQLQALGLHWDAAPVWQTQRHALYAQAFARLRAANRVYACHCTRRELPPGPYPGTCRPTMVGASAHAGRHAPASPPSDEGPLFASVVVDDKPNDGVPNTALPRDPAQSGKPPPQTPRARKAAWRFLVESGIETFRDRWLGTQSQDVAAAVGDFIIRRADGLWAYQLVVVVDDARQGVTDIVRGADLLDSTARQQHLARALGLRYPRVMHVPLILDAAGRKLSKQNHAPALNLDAPLECLQQAWQALGFARLSVATLDAFWPQATAQWARRFVP
ncbi:glutamyl-Q tRNA(Asp) synthetase [Castellaniella caeni]|uniref:glutamyl-Q tRNA(Asp) synthetase n=1 Tax=Castellaniella caeni TaxID=266123 RepID=UPI000B2CDC70|nr:glutamyl-Q tRNA(Asp) synthetase [Castellaniella caeni]